MKERLSEVSVSQALEEEIKRQRKRMATLKEARMLSKKEESIRLQLIQMLGDFYSALKERNSTEDTGNREDRKENEADFSFIKDCFRVKEEERQQEVEKTGKMLSNALNFLGNTFGEGQELLLFLSELTKSPYALSFLSDVGNETYSRYNQYLLLKDKQKALQEEAKEAFSPPATSAAPAASGESAPKVQARGTDMRKEDIGGDFTLTDGDGKPFSLSDLKGKVVILSFGYTHCPDVCPTELLTYSDTLKQLGDQAKDVKVVFVSIDPERDTPEVIGKYAKQFNPDFIGLTATGDQSLPVIKQQYRVVSAKVNQKEDSENYLVDHSSGAYLIDKNGEVAIFSPYGSEPETIAADVKTLL